MSALAAIALAAALTAPAATTEEVKTDGKINATEWSRAKRVALGDGVTLLVMADQETVALAVKSAGRRFTDLYIALPDQTVLNLHASMQLGQRKLSGTSWTDDDPPWNWGYTSGWRANVVTYRAGTETLAPFDGQEFLIERALQPGKTWLLRIEARDFQSEKPDAIYPETTTRHDTTGWATLTLP